ncbi:MAG TPA: nucleotidyltransferase domain-containing protein [Candidatus Saccharimonadales bacterium]|nr:nucleotidyltransferase domain-containing protein [Candidatus Saccharimonadales bacterium]
MAESKIYISDRIDAQFREAAMKRFGYGRGSISLAAEEAIVQWLVKEDRIQSCLKRLLDEARKDNDVIAVLLFGSYARKEADYRDIDVAILLKNDADAYEEELRYHHLVGGHDEKLIDLSILNRLPLDLQSRVLDEAEVLYVKEASAFYDYSLGVIRDWSEFKYRMEMVSER